MQKLEQSQKDLTVNWVFLMVNYPLEHVSIQLDGRALKTPRSHTNLRPFLKGDGTGSMG